MKTPLYLFAFLCAAVCAGAWSEDIPENAEKPPTGLEAGNWAVESWGNPGKLGKLHVGARTLLQLDYSPGKNVKTAFKFSPGFDPSADKILRLWIYSELNEPPQIALAVGAGLKFQWHESLLINLHKGWNAVAMPLAAPNWKTEASDWKFTAGVEPPDMLRYLAILIYNGEKEGRLFAEGVCPPPAVNPVDAKAADDPETWRGGWKRLARFGPGFVVWQSNRTGMFRIMRRNLDGSEERPLSASVEDRQQVAAHIAPDGKHIVYLSLPEKLGSGERLQPPDVIMPLRVVNADGNDDHILVPNARTYMGDRCAVWASPDELIYISETNATRIHNLKTHADELLYSHPNNSGWVLNPQKTFATLGLPPNISRYDAHKQELSSLVQQEGCQCYFSYATPDAVWMHSSGGPIAHINLETLEVNDILKYHDPRLPKSRNYAYFPMPSRCGRLLAFAASPNQHDPTTSDYDVFVGELDRDTYEMVGDPVRYSFEEHADIYPDVFAPPPELGYKSGKAPLSVHFDAPGDGDWEWDFGDGQSAKSAAPAHVYQNPGGYVAVARQGLIEKRAWVQTRSQDLAAKVRPKLDDSAWPVNRTGLVFLWETSNQPNMVVDPGKKDPRHCLLTAKGPAFLDHDFRMWLNGGVFSAEETRSIAEAVNASGAFSLELTVQPAPGESPKSAPIMAYSDGLEHDNFSLTQSGDDLVVYVRTANAADRGGSTLKVLHAFTPGVRTHIAVACKSTSLICRVNNLPAALATLSAEVKNWNAEPLTFGGSGGRRWQGWIEGAAFYDRMLDVDETNRNAARYAKTLASRKSVPALTLDAKLKARTEIPPLKKIAPYVRALVVYEYEVATVISGECNAKTIRVLHWGLIDAEPTSIKDRKPGDTVRLALEPYDAQPQLQFEFRTDELPEAFDLPLYYDVQFDASKK